MAVIKQFEAPQLGLQPTEIGVEAAAGAGRRLGAFYNQAAQAQERFGEQAGRELGGAIRDAGDVAVNHIDHQQITEGGAKGAELFENLTEAKNKIVRDIDPNDPQYGQKVESALKQWREDKLDPALQQFSGGFTTEKSQAWADHFIASTRQHMFASTAADISTAAKIGITNSIKTFQNSSTNTAFNDPSSMPALLDAAGHTIGGMVGSSNLKGTDAAQVHSAVLEDTREKIVKAAAIGYIEKTAKVPDWVSDPAYSKYVNGIELKQFQKAADAQRKANDYYDRGTETLKKQQADLAVDRGINDVITKGVAVDPNSPGKLLIAPDAMQKVLDVVRKNPEAPNAAGHARTTLDWLQHQQAEKPTATDPATKTALYTGMFSADKPTADVDIYKAEVEGRLSRTDAQSLLQLNKALTQEPLRGPIYQDTMKAVHAELVLSNVGLPGKDIAGESNYAKFAQSFIPDYLAKKRAGTLEPNALDVKDPNSMISKAMAPFRRTVQQRMSDYIATVGGAAPPTVPGAAPAAPAATLPPLSDREKGKVYPTAAGNMKWTGTGWVKP